MGSQNNSKTGTSDSLYGSISSSLPQGKEKEMPFEKTSEQAVLKQQLDDENRGQSRDFSKPYSKLPSPQRHPLFSEEELKREMEKEEYNHVKNSEPGTREGNLSQANLTNSNTAYIDPKVVIDYDMSHRPHISEIHNHPLHSQNLSSSNKSYENESGKSLMDETEPYMRKMQDRARM